MSDIIKIKDLAIEAMKKKDLSDFAISQYQLIEKLQKENDLLKQKLSHMETVIVQQTAQKAAPLSNEEIICIEQIDIIKKSSKNRELSLDEVKRLDLLIKNLRLIRQQSTQVIESVDYVNMKEADLVAFLESPPNK